MDALTRYYRMKGDNTTVAAGHRPRRHRHADRGSSASWMRKASRATTSGREKFHRKGLGMEGYSGGTITRQMRRLGTSPDWTARAFHDGCRPQQGRHRNLRAPVQRRPDLPRQAPGQLGPGAATPPSPTSKSCRRKKTASCGTSAIRWLTARHSLARSPQRAAGNHARRHRR